MIHPDTELLYINNEIGYGVFATKRIPMGSITWALDPLDQVISQKRWTKLRRSMKETFEKYTYTDAKGNQILCWDFARLMNHSCEPNSLSPGLNFELAIRDIEKGEELTCDYGSLNLDAPFHCKCGSRSCREILQPEDFITYAPRWDKSLQQAFSFIDKVQQPLWHLVRDKAAISSGLRHKSRIPSILMHRWNVESNKKSPTQSSKATS